MDRNNISKDLLTKLSGHTWITLGKIAEGEEITLLVRTKDKDANFFKSEIEATGYRMFTTLGNKATLIGRVNNIQNLARLDCIEYIESGIPVGEEKEDTSIE